MPVAEALEQGWGHSYVDLDPAPLFPFGHGLSYTSFEFSALRTDERDGVRLRSTDGSSEVAEVW